MNIPISAVIIVVIFFGFLTGSTLYFYNKSDNTKPKTEVVEEFNADIPAVGSSSQPEKVDELTKPAEPKGRITYPSNVYTVQSGDTLFGIGSKFELDWKLIVLANGLESENVVQVGKSLVIPKLSHETDYYRINFSLDEDNASNKNRELRDIKESDSYNPILVSKASAIPYFSVSQEDEFTLVEQDNSAGKALVKATNTDKENFIGLFQPKQKGEKGLWAVLYIEHHD